MAYRCDLQDRTDELYLPSSGTKDDPIVRIQYYNPRTCQEIPHRGVLEAAANPSVEPIRIRQVIDAAYYGWIRVRDYMRTDSDIEK